MRADVAAPVKHRADLEKEKKQPQQAERYQRRRRARALEGRDDTGPSGHRDRAKRLGAALAFDPRWRGGNDTCAEKNRQRTGAKHRATIASEPTEREKSALDRDRNQPPERLQYDRDDDRFYPVHDSLELRQRSETHISPRRGHHEKHRRNNEAYAGHHQPLPAAALMADMQSPSRWSSALESDWLRRAYRGILRARAIRAAARIPLPSSRYAPPGRRTQWCQDAKTKPQSPVTSADPAVMRAKAAAPGAKTKPQPRTTSAGSPSSEEIREKKTDRGAGQSDCVGADGVGVGKPAAKETEAAAKSRTKLIAETAANAAATAATIAAKAMEIAADIAAAETGPIAVAKAAAKAAAIADRGWIAFYRHSVPDPAKPDLTLPDPAIRVRSVPPSCRATNESGTRKLAAEQRRFADRQSQRVTAQPVQRDLRGENLYPVAVAA